MYILKEFKRKDGSKVNIRVDLHFRSFSQDEFSYQISVKTKDKGKRKWIPVVGGDGWDYRSSDNKDRYLIDKYLDIVTREEIYETQMELWEKSKPTFGKFEASVI